MMTSKRSSATSDIEDRQAYSCSILKVTHAALYIACALLLPQLFHFAGLGKYFLPMHIPVIVGGMMLGWSCGFLIGFISPLLSALLFGMPPLAPPVAAQMMCELAIVGSFSGIFFRLCRENAFVTLILTVIAGRIMWGLFAYLCLPLFGLPGISIFYPITVGILSCWPGIAVQLIIIPPLVLALKRIGRRS